jgi:transcriptional regulator with XRE-family HTH domain
MFSVQDKEIGARVAEARKARHMSQEELARSLGVGPTVMSKIENGKRRLDGFEIALVAETLGTTPRSLLGMATRTAALRAAARLGPGDSQPALNRARDLLELDGIADEMGVAGRPAPRRLNRPDGAGMRAAGEAARAVLELHGGGVDGTGDLIGVVERDFGVDVAVEPLGEGPAGLLVQHADEIALIVLNRDDHPTRRRFTLAHELGHWLLGDSEPVIVENTFGDDTDIERRANRFAVELLMPEGGVRNVMAKVGDPVSGVVDGLVRFGVSREAFLNRLVDLRLVDRKQAEQLSAGTVRSLFARAGRHADYEAWSAPGPERRLPSRMEKRFIDAYSQGRIGIGLLAQAFNERPSVLCERLAEHGITPDPPSTGRALAAV